MDQRHPDEQHAPDEQTRDPVSGPPTPEATGTTAGGWPETTESTGVAEVDAVLASLGDLADRPVAEHVTVFEQAHERLRRALDAPAD